MAINNQTVITPVNVNPSMILPEDEIDYYDINSCIWDY